MFVINGNFLYQPLTGVQRYADEISKFLVKDHGFAIATSAMKKPTRGTSFEGHFLPQKPTLLTKLGRGRAWSFLDLPVNLRPTDVVWTTCNIALPLRTKHVVTVHDIAVLKHPEWFSRKFALLHRALLPMTVHRSKHIFTVSEFSKREICAHFGVKESKVSVTYNAVSETFVPRGGGAISRVKERLGIEGPYLLSVGSLDPRKNLASVLRAWKRIAGNVDSSCKLVVVGGTFTSFPASYLADLPDGDGSVIMAGRCDDEDLCALYSGCAGFVFASLYEGFGLPPLEALACGAYIIASDRTALPEVLGEHASYCDPFDVEQMAELFFDCLTNDRRPVDVTAVRRKMALKFNWEEAAKTVASVCRNVEENS